MRARGRRLLAARRSGGRFFRLSLIGHYAAHNSARFELRCAVDRGHGFLCRPLDFGLEFIFGQIGKTLPA